MALTTWITTQKTNITLSNANLTATGTSVISGVRGADTQISGKFYWEITTGAAFAGSGGCIGICNGNATASGIFTNSANAAVVFKNGAIWVNGINTGSSLTAFSTSALICVAVDLTAKLIWYRLTAGGNWNGSGTADPATGAGGLSIANFTPPYQNLYPYLGVSAVNDVATANFGGCHFWDGNDLAIRVDG